MKELLIQEIEEAINFAKENKNIYSNDYYEGAMGQLKWMLIMIKQFEDENRTGKN